MSALHILAAWIAASILAGLALGHVARVNHALRQNARHQHGEGNGTGRGDQTHNGWDIP